MLYTHTVQLLIELAGEQMVGGSLGYHRLGPFAFDPDKASPQSVGEHSFAVEGALDILVVVEGAHQVEGEHNFAVEGPLDILVVVGGAHQV